MSETVSQALFLTGGKEAFETAYFIGKIDKLFDCLNVSFSRMIYWGIYKGGNSQS